MGVAPHSSVTWVPALSPYWLRHFIFMHSYSSPDKPWQLPCSLGHPVLFPICLFLPSHSVSLESSHTSHIHSCITNLTNLCLSKHCSLLFHPKRSSLRKASPLLFLMVAVMVWLVHRMNYTAFLYFLPDCVKKQINCDFFFRDQKGMRKQETEKRNVKVRAHWSRRGRCRLDVYRSKTQ